MTMDRFIDRIAKRLASSESLNERQSRRQLFRRSAKATAGLAAGMVLANSAVKDAGADTPAACGVSAFSAVFTGTTTAAANCRACPFTTSGVATVIGAGQNVSFGQGTNQGSVVSGNSTWYRTSGPIGCWIWSGLIA